MGAVTRPNEIYIERLNKSYSQQQTAGDLHYIIQDVDLVVKGGEFFVLLGPSGCGKSTLLSLIAGFVSKTSGHLRVGEREVDRPGLGVKRIPAARRKEISDRFIGMVGLKGHENKFPRELSGGMKQRVQLARVLSNDPGILLMDEPFGALDAMTRRTMQRELVKIWQETDKTVIFVTHDIQEALLLGGRIGIMSAGPSSRITDIYEVPLAYPRDLAAPEFHDLYNRIQAHFDE